jgi:hypothetical protein
MLVDFAACVRLSKFGTTGVLSSFLLEAERSNNAGLRHKDIIKLPAEMRLELEKQIEFLCHTDEDVESLRVYGALASRIGTGSSTVSFRVQFLELFVFKETCTESEVVWLFQLHESEEITLKLDLTDSKSIQTLVSSCSVFCDVYISFVEFRTRKMWAPWSP